MVGEGEGRVEGEEGKKGVRGGGLVGGGGRKRAFDVFGEGCSGSTTKAKGGDRINVADGQIRV